MSGLISGTGLMSGLPTAQIIDSLMAQAARPKTVLSNKLTKVQAIRTNLSAINAKLLALKTSVAALKNASFFNKFSATSSDESAVVATASSSAVPGSINLQVRSLVSTHQLVSRGFSTSNSTPVGAGEITVEIGNGLLERRTALGDLNGGQGVRRGVFRITDGSGASADIDISGAVDVRDVLDEINSADGIQVQARVEGSRIVLVDQSGGTGQLTVIDLRGGNAALDLGIRQSVSGGTLTGREVHYLADGTALDVLNDGNGVRTTVGVDDFRITNGAGTAFNVRLDGTLTDSTKLAVLNSGNGVRLGTIRITNRAGQTGTVDLSAAETIGDIRAAIAAATDANGNSLNVTVSTRTIGGVGSLALNDASVPTSEEDENDEDGEESATTTAFQPKLTIEDVSGFAARDLGIAQTSESGTIGGSGIHRVTTIGDVIRAINYADGNDGTITASLMSNGLRLMDTSGGGDALMVEALSDGRGGFSKAAADLGIEGAHKNELETRHLLAGLNTVLLHSLNGGNGLELGKVSFTTGDGATVEVDFKGAQTVQDLLQRIHSRVPGLQAELNAVGHGLALTDVSGGSGPLVVADVTGTLAEKAGLAGTFARGQVSGSNLQLQYYNEATALTELNGGRGIRTGRVEIRTSTGAIFSVEINSSAKTLGDVIKAINEVSTAFGVTAGINASGDGLALTDTNGGSERLRVADLQGGSTAKDLRLAGEAEVGSNLIDGSYEIRVLVEAGDTLEKVAAKLRGASPDLHASVLNDGASTTPYRLSVTSGLSGRRGQLLFDAGGTGLDMSTLVAARDAVALIGGQNGESPIVVSSSTNTLSDVMPGVELTLKNVTSESVTITTGRDIEGVLEDLRKFVDGYNGVIDAITTATAYNAETQTRGPLMGESAVFATETRFARAVLQRNTSAPDGYQTLSALGIRVESGGRLQFDEDVFRERFGDNPEAVRNFFAEGDRSFGAVFDKLIEDLTSTTNGLFTQRDEALGAQVEDITERMTDFDERLKVRRAQLERQYANLESVLAKMQDQQSALAQLAALLPG